jgi:hypothetical protein
MLVLANLLEQEWFVNALGVVVVAFATGLAGIISLLFLRLQNWLATKTKNETLQKATLLAQDLVLSAVQAVQQTFVEQLKKDGKFDKDAQLEALEKALKLVLAQIKPDAMAILTEAYGDLSKWLTMQIEATVYGILPHGKS